MKKKVLCIFSLILYLLVACTIMSHWIEDQMMTQVTISERKNRGDSFSFKQSVLFADDQGKHLYEMIDGTGWNSGLRVSMLPDASWYINTINNAVEYDGNKQSYRFITSASRLPTEGEAVKVIENIRKADDQYLCIFTHGIPEELLLPKNAEITAQSETVLLLNLKEAEFPFFEQTAKGMTDTLSAADRIIGLTEVKQFLEDLPLIALVSVVLIGGVVFWGAACLFSIRADENMTFIGINTALVAASLVFMILVLNRIDLPASMMPVDNIFNWEYYSAELSLVCNALQELSLMELPRLMDNIVRQFSGILHYGAIGVLSIIAFEGIILIFRSRKYRI